MMLMHRTFWLVLPSLLLGAVAPAHAQGADAFKLTAGYELQTDNNLFRLPAGADASALVGRSSASEQIGVASLGARFHKDYSLQRIELDASLVDYRYRNFDYLDYTALNYSAAWRWSFTPRLRGSLSAERKETQNSFADFQNYAVSNLRVDTSKRFDAIYEIDGVWRVLGGLAQTAESNELPVVTEADFSAASAHVGVRYVFGSGTALTYTYRSNDGEYRNRVLSVVSLLDDAYKQVDHDLRLRWIFSGKGAAEFNVTPFRRTHPNFAQRDYNAVNAGARLDWNLGAKLGLSAGWAREYSDWQSSDTNYARTDRVTLGPVWQISPKMVARLRYEWAQRDLLGSPTGASPSSRSDTTRDTTLSFDWEPYRFLTLSAGLRNTKRTGTPAGLDYSAHGATLSARLSY